MLRPGHGDAPLPDLAELDRFVVLALESRGQTMT